jgi:uncharacterized protein DUF4124
MKIIFLFIINLLILSIVNAETVYKTRDAEGNVIFSDVPADGAEEIEVNEAQTINIPQVKLPENRPTTKLIPKETEYIRLEITNPVNDTTIRSNEGNVSINLEVEPALAEEDVFLLFIDGKEVSSGKAKQFSLSNMDRGSHSVYVAVKNEKDKVLKQSNKLVFHLRKESKLFINRQDDASITPINTGVVTESPDNSDSSPVIPTL